MRTIKDKFLLKREKYRKNPLSKKQPLNRVVVKILMMMVTIQ